MIAAYFPEEKRATMNGLFTAAIPMGTAIGVVLGGIIAVNWGWRYAFGLLAIPGLLVAILFFWVKDYKTVLITKNAGGSEVKMGWKDITLEFLRTPTVLFTYVGYVVNTFVTTAPMFAAGGSAVTQDVVHPGLRAISYSLAQFFMMLFGYSLSPIFVGAISDRYDLLTAFKFLPLFSLLGAIGFFIGAFYYGRDYNKVQKVKLETSE